MARNRTFNKPEDLSAIIPEEQEFFFDESGLEATTGEIAQKVANVWDQEGTFKKLQEIRKYSPCYKIYDGPPFATGLPHYGHFLPMTLKDWAFRFHSMQGKNAAMKGGWDTHGVPIETLVQNEMGLKTTQDIEEVGIDTFSDACRATVLRYVDEWNYTQRILGRWIDMEDPYATMDADYIESVWYIFSRLFEKGLVYEGKKVVAYSPALGTPLSNFEADQNYKEIIDPALTVAFELDDGSKMLAWTTTPWSLISNLAIAVGENIDYVKVKKDGEKYIMAKDRLTILEENSYEIVDEFKGVNLVGEIYKPPFDIYRSNENAFKVISSDHVTLEAGTGIVHIAPAYGEDDFKLGDEHGLGLVDPIDSAGNFTDEIPELAGVNFRDANKQIIEILKDSGKLFSEEQFTHSYPHCYRTDQPLMYKAVSSWFIKVTDFKDRMVELNDDIRWIPDHLQQGRFGDWLKNARDWSVSRNRYWGAPLPIWKCEETGETIVVNSREQLYELSGEKPDDLHKAVVDGITFEIGGRKYKRVKEIFDCWFESGAMPYASEHFPFEEQDIEKPPIPADFIAEGLDQTRGWFYTLNVLSTALYDKPAFKNVIVNGMVLANNEAGEWVKMSKKLKNYPNPNKLLERIGGDAMRFFILGSGAAKAEPLKFSESGLDEIVRKVLLPLWNIYKFFITYANADGWEPTSELRNDVQSGTSEKQSGNQLDQWALARLEKAHQEITDAFEENNLPKATREITKFINDISNWFVRLSRDRFWKSGDSEDKDDAYKTLYEILVRLTQMIAPVCPFISEEIYRTLTKESSVHHSLWPQENKSHQNPQLLEKMEEVRKIVAIGLKLRNKSNLRVRQPLSEVIIILKPGIDIEGLDEMIKSELNVKNVRFISEGDTDTFKPIIILNRAVLGRKLKDGLKTVITKLNEEDYELSGTTLKIADYELSTTEDDFSISYEPRENKVAETHEGYTVVLNLEMNEELEMEGIARDLIRIIQSERKAHNLNITDRINVEITGDNAVINCVNSFNALIKTAVLANTLSSSSEIDDSEIKNEKKQIKGHRLNVKIDL